MADLITTSSEGKRLYSLYRELPEGPVAKVAKQEPIQPASWTKIKQLAKSLVSEGKAQTIQEAVAQVATAHPDLYRDYRHEIQ